MRSPPPLSASQRAYTFQREKFLAGIATRAERLADDGYTVEAGERCHEYLVTPPNTHIPYLVNALRHTCTCCFYRRQMEGEPLAEDGLIVPCKHLRGLKALIRAQYRRLQQEQRWCCYYRLRLHWLQTLAAQWQEHQREQQQREEAQSASPTLLCRHCAAQGTPCDARFKGDRTR